MSTPECHGFEAIKERMSDASLGGLYAYDGAVAQEIVRLQQGKLDVEERVEVLARENRTLEAGLAALEKKVEDLESTLERAVERIEALEGVPIPMPDDFTNPASERLTKLQREVESLACASEAAHKSGVSVDDMIRLIEAAKR